jgi:hypothetical protein
MIFTIISAVEIYLSMRYNKAITAKRLLEGYVVEKRMNRDQRFLSLLEDVTLALRKSKTAYQLDEESDHPQLNRLHHLETLLATERRLIEEISPPCRLVLEHFTLLRDRPDQMIRFRYDLIEAGKGSFHGFVINEWGHVTVNIGNTFIAWRDEDYQYMFYPNKIILRALDATKPELHFAFDFSLKYSRLLEDFRDVPVHPHTIYIHPDLFPDSHSQ